MGRFRRNGRLAGASPKLLGNTATVERGAKKAQGSRGERKKPMPAVERLGRASFLLSVWFRAAAPEEIRKRPGMVVVVVDRDNFSVCDENKTTEKTYLDRIDW
ncbi:hypothetical protein ILYODFUR_031843 [Ilyodon furcidens]|uniref:Uncharacterized protein n=1 Tax=Ilyodon furcidens TaxID=33524 RepID=A0ABV0TCP7_9TELE